MTDQAPAEITPVVPLMRMTGVIKWYDASRRYGFVQCGSDDVLLHASRLKEAHLTEVQKGSECVVDVERGPRGLTVAHIVTLTNNFVPPDLEGFVSARVKWFSSECGYGFLTRGPNTLDIFVHAEEIRRAQIAGLEQNQELLVRIEAGPKGLKAAEIRQPV